MKVYISQATFNSQDEYDEYINLDLQEQAEEDHIYDVYRIEIGYRGVILYRTESDYKRIWYDSTGAQHLFVCGDGTERFPRRIGSRYRDAISIAVDAAFTNDVKQFKAIITHGPKFRPLIITADDENKTCKIADRDEVVA